MSEIAGLEPAGVAREDDTLVASGLAQLHVLEAALVDAKVDRRARQEQQAVGRELRQVVEAEKHELFLQTLRVAPANIITLA